jgi:hypothetical protein
MAGLLLVISFAELLILSKLTADPARLVHLSLISLFFTRLVIFPWQLVGLFRAAEQDFIAHGSILKTRSIQALALLSVLFTMIYSVEVLQSAIFYKQQADLKAKPKGRADYRLVLESGGLRLHISGDLDVGITNAARSLLEKNPQISSVVLESPGGQIYEGRGLSKLFTEYQLDTYTYQECSSACVTAFVGGPQRYLGAEAKLGFHQYKIESSPYQLLFALYDTQAEQKRDLALFKARKISPVFLNKIFDKPGNQIWFPAHSELLEARVVHFILPLGTKP